ncbi:MAG: Endopolyphosphatase [Chrysothrix sp. TS-e1954]|nr:MAG: Endopolyphosphatase [Chrysothrix sp. TS-e1954]
MAMGSVCVPLVASLLLSTHLNFAHALASIPFLDSPSGQVVLGGSKSPESRPLTGKFLHITDIHPDPFYKVHSATDGGSACHRGTGDAGPLGAETTDCDSPHSLVNATFEWIATNLRDSVDFVVWTGDSARHDNDDHYRRTKKQVLGQNEDLVDRMLDVFGTGQDGLTIPIVPTIGNNDLVPHNIMKNGPNHWTKEYARMWRRFIPKKQQHQFKRGGWFYVEAIPNRLAVFSLNTMYFFERNTAVDGCASSKYSGYEQMEWLRVQLQHMRERGMKAIISGHVPPARTNDRTGWDETCWQKYALWMRQYRDVVVGSLYGHMNIDHFVLQDFQDIDHKVALGQEPARHKMQHSRQESAQGDIQAYAADDYLVSLRKQWSKLPNMAREIGDPKKCKEDKSYDSIGGKWVERFSVSMTSPSVVPNFLPTLRVFEYNITGLSHVSQTHETNAQLESNVEYRDSRKKGKQPNGEKPKFTVPDPPSKSAPPGPAYSPQTFSLLGYMQYFANLTAINNATPTIAYNKANHGPLSSDFEYEEEYDTRSKDDPFGLQHGLLVRNMVRLASNIGRSKAGKTDVVDSQASEPDDETGSDGSNQRPHSSEEVEMSMENTKGKKKHHKKKKKRRRIANKAWFAFVQRAYVGTMDEEDLHNTFGEETDD